MRLFVAAALLSAAACAPHNLRTLAANGDTERLRSALEAHHAHGTLTNEEGREIARGVLERDLAQVGAAGAAPFFTAVDACVPLLQRRIVQRAELNDAVASAAWLALAEHGLLSTAEELKNRAPDETVRRAIAARALIGNANTEKRREALRDASPLVREGALAAVEASEDAADAPALFESIRVDPDIGLRLRSIHVARTLARKWPTTPIAPFVEALTDAVGESRPLDDSLTRTWAMDPFYENGGRAHLERALGSTSPRSFAAAMAIVDAPPRTAPEERALIESAHTVVAERLRLTPLPQKLETVRVAPLTDRIVSELGLLKTIAEPTFHAALMARLVAVPEFEKEALSELLRISSDFSHPEAKAIATFALAERGDRRVQFYIEQDLKAPLPGRKIAAARALSLSGNAARAAILLTDKDAAVRDTVACMLLRR